MTRLEGANLYGAKLEGAFLFGANLSEANLGYANLEGAHLGGASFDEKTVLPDANVIGNDDDGNPIYDKYWKPEPETDMSRYTNPEEHRGDEE